jgi:hypothetical protein
MRGKFARGIFYLQENELVTGNHFLSEGKRGEIQQYKNTTKRIFEYTVMKGER